MRCITLSWLEPGRRLDDGSADYVGYVMTSAINDQSLDTGEDRQVAQQLAAVEDRLVAHYRDEAGVGEERTRQTFEVVKSRFAEATVRNFLPILIERGVRTALST